MIYLLNHLLKQRVIKSFFEKLKKKILDTTDMYVVKSLTLTRREEADGA